MKQSRVKRYVVSAKNSQEDIVYRYIRYAQTENQAISLCKKMYNEVKDFYHLNDNAENYTWEAKEIPYGN